eukprot:COSAG06_NODE_7821_length_2363_cov_15.210247_2_plen_71_part_00
MDWWFTVGADSSSRRVVSANPHATPAAETAPLRYHLVPTSLPSAKFCHSIYRLNCRSSSALGGSLVRLSF